MLTKKEEFDARRRMNRHVFRPCEPDMERLKIKLEQKYIEEHMSTDSKKYLVKSAIDQLCGQLRIKGKKYEIQPNNKIMRFHSGRRWVVMTWCWSGYITIKSNLENEHEICFMISDYRDIVDKMEKFQVIFRKDFI